ncbi:hypothetical protein CBR_g31715 [Chara braunii]|uniref:Myb/SANT-like DNA-binding domain-containing protein n=1 Tax=Chara braunii TaxID=69332 RepID=A0A388JY43_CHABU|nr:hypothetical protein CBR_g31715 [Chara braunii]|eukprot:GBG62698.1 hypothetical protein CBR_g31715 [Chara braunii]
MADLLHRLPLLFLVVLLLLAVVFYHVCLIGLVPAASRRRRSPKKADRMAGRLPNGRPAGTSGGSINRQRSAGSVAKQPYDPRLYAYLPSHEIPLPSSDDEGREARSPTLPLGSGSTQDWAATQSCGARGVETPWSYTSLLNEGLGDDDGDAAVHLSFHLSSSSGAAAMHTRIINPHPGGDCAENTQGAVCGPRDDGLPQSVRDGGGDRNNSSPSVGGGFSAQRRLDWMRLLPAEDLIGGVPDVQRDGRQVWAECRQELHRGETKTITRGVQRLHVDEVEDTAVDEGQGCDDVDGEDSCKSDDLPDIRPLGRRATRGGSGAKKGPATKPRRTKNMDDDGVGGRNFWSVGDMVALVRAKRDQDLYIAGLGTSFACMKMAAWKWEDVRVRLQAMGVTRDVVDCGKKWDNLMQQFKKVHKFHNLSGGKDYFRLALRDRRSEGFSFVMDQSVYDEMEAMTKGDHTIHPANLAATGAAGGVQMPAGAGGGGGTMGGDGGGETADEEQGSTKDSSFGAGSGGGYGKRKNMRQQTFEAVADVMEKHGALMASTMDSASKRQCSMIIKLSLQHIQYWRSVHTVTSDEIHAGRHLPSVLDAPRSHRMVAPVFALHEWDFCTVVVDRARRSSGKHKDVHAEQTVLIVADNSTSFRGVGRGKKRENVPADTQRRSGGRQHVPKSKRLRSEEPSPKDPVRRGRYWAASNEDEDDGVFMTEEEAADDTVAAPRGSSLQAKNDQAAARRLPTPSPEEQQGCGQSNTKAKEVVVDVRDEDNEPLGSRRKRNAMQGATATGVRIHAAHEERPPQGAMSSTPSQPRPRNTAADGGSTERGGGEVAQQEACVASAGAGAGSSGNVAVVAGAREEVLVVEREVERGENKGKKEDDDPLLSRERRGGLARDLADRTRLWVDDKAFWTTGEGRRLYDIVHRTWKHFEAIASGVQAPVVSRSIVMPKSATTLTRIVDPAQLQQAIIRGGAAENIALRVLHGWVFKSGNRPRGYNLAFRPQYRLATVVCGGEHRRQAGGR